MPSIILINDITGIKTHYVHLSTGGPTTYTINNLDRSTPIFIIATGYNGDSTDRLTVALVHWNYSKSKFDLTELAGNFSSAFNYSYTDFNSITFSKNAFNMLAIFIY